MSKNASVSKHCPAFAGGYPYPKAVERASSEQKDLLRAVQDCPEFRKNGCPFKDAGDTVQAMEEKIKEMPPSHGAGGEHEGAVKGAFKAFHAMSFRIREHEMAGAECPVFQLSGCPFKGAALLSNGQPLVSQLDDFHLWIEDQVRNSEDPQMPEDAQRTTENRDPSAPSPPKTTLSKYLKDGTRVAHEEAEKVRFVKNFLKCRISPELYLEMITDLYFIYREMERGIQAHLENSVLQAMHFPELNRAESLKADVSHLRGGSMWVYFIGPSQAGAEYVQHLRNLADGSQNSATLLLAHAYTRYLGDLSGGQFLRRAAKRILRDRLGPNEEGLTFYNFSAIDNAKAFKKEYRDRLDSLPISPAAADALVREANVAFVMNTRLFQQLDVSAGVRNSVDPIEKMLGSLDVPDAAPRTPGSGTSAAGGCPFGFAAKDASMPTGHAKLVEKTRVATKGAVHKKCPMPFRILHDPSCLLERDGMPWTLVLFAICAYYVVYAYKLHD